MSISSEAKYGLTCDKRQAEVWFAKQKRCPCCRAVRTPDPKKVRDARRGNPALRRTKWGKCRGAPSVSSAGVKQAGVKQAGVKQEGRASALKPARRQRPPGGVQGRRPPCTTPRQRPLLPGMTQTAAGWPTSRSQRASEAEDSVACHGFRRSERTRDHGSCLAANDPELC